MLMLQLSMTLSTLDPTPMFKNPPQILHLHIQLRVIVCKNVVNFQHWAKDDIILIHIKFIHHHCALTKNENDHDEIISPVAAKSK